MARKTEKWKREKCKNYIDKMGNRHKSSKDKVPQNKYFSSDESYKIEWIGESCGKDKKKGSTYYR